MTALICVIAQANDCDDVTSHNAPDFLPHDGGSRSRMTKCGNANRWATLEGTPGPLGVYYVCESDAYNFSIYSKHATGLKLLLYRKDDPLSPALVREFDPRINKSGRVWHCRIPAADVDTSAFYAYQVDGPYQRAEGQQFDPQKILIDPYARSIHFPPQFSRDAACHRGINAGRAPLGVIHHGAEVSGEPVTPRQVHTHDAIIYELHVRGFTKRENSRVPAAHRGTFLGVADKIPYLKDLGVTVVELMPIFQFDPQEGNYWGYMPISFFAIHGSYACGDEKARAGEFKQLVNALHEAGMDIVLDVVYNHTGEGGEGGPTYSFRAIDNTTYYLLDERGGYRNDSGTGNVLHTANRYVAGMVLDSLSYWSSTFQIDGFRFDLASLFTRASDGSIDLDHAPVIGAIHSHPNLRHLRMIAEAWDMSSYQLGRTFPGIAWLQWNGSFRDDMRAFVRGDCGHVERMMQRLSGNGDIFPDDLMNAYHAYQSVNFVTCHDGFSLYDLVSYNEKHNEANGHGNRDGNNRNLSWNCGWEGDESVPETVARLRRRQAKNLFCLMMLANGTPMFLAGDEFLNAQGGNNNPYNQDNETTWLDWDLLDKNSDFYRFCRLMIAFRKKHPSLGRSRHWRQDVQWHGARGGIDIASTSREFAFCLRGASQQDVDLYVMANAGLDDNEFTVQESTEGGWARVIDTALEPPDDLIDGSTAQVLEMSYRVQGRSVVVLMQHTETV